MPVLLPELIWAADRSYMLDDERRYTRSDPDV